MALTEAQKRQRKIARRIEKFRCDRGITQRKKVLAKLQRLVKLKARDKDGNVKCVTCGRVRPANQRSMQGGHFIAAKHTATCFDERNIHVQCNQCNERYEGSAYRAFMVREYGYEVVRELETASKEKREWTIEELATMYVRFNEEIRELENG